MLNEKMIVILKMEGYTITENLLDIDFPEEGYSDDVIEFEGCEYLVVTEDKAEELAIESIHNLIDDMGLQSFSEGFQSWIINNCLNEEWFEDAMRESYEFYMNDIREEDCCEDEEGNETNRLTEEMEEANCTTEEDFLDYLCDYQGGAVEWYRDNFGEEQLSEIAKNNNLIDWDEAIEECISIDGIAHTLASYDGNENTEVVDDETYYIYRIN